MEAEEVLQLIRDRRSRRVYANEPVGPEAAEVILEAGRWAPSGMNNQPWRFVVVTAQVKEKLAGFTKYGRIVRTAAALIPVFIHKPSMYHQVKDSQAVGACLQNTCCSWPKTWAWGRSDQVEIILAQAQAVRLALGVSPEHELMAVLALGWPAKEALQGKRKPLEQLMLTRLG